MAVSKALRIAAQAIMDAYYQDFKPDDAFFDLDDFAAWLGKAYGGVADTVAKEIYDASRIEGMPMIIFSQDWWAKKTISIKEKSADISDLKFTGFTYDSQTSGIQQVGNGVRFVRTTLTELWQLEGRRTPSSIIYWYADFDKIKFIATCDLPKEVEVYYIPTPEDSNFKLPKSKEFEIATIAWNFMISAKKETPFVDTTNNSNKNITPATEVDTATAQPIK